ncbi:MAG: nucleoside deaminase [Rickettsiaceae bacterium]|nr:MAG: nucleoside deaminase [Rickettsiaceae bacterium]
MNAHFFDNQFMLQTLELAKTAYDSGEIPVGALIVNRFSKKIITKTHNLVQKNNDSILHAEIIAIHNACISVGSKNLSDFDIYISLEPCTMCAAAISISKISRLFYGAADPKQGAVENGVRFFTSSSCFHRPEIYPDLQRDSSATLIKSFFAQIRVKEICKL